MNTIYVIAKEVQRGYEDDSVKPIFITETRYNFGFWDNELDARQYCLGMNALSIPEDDSEAGEPYFVLSIEKAKV